MMTMIDPRYEKGVLRRNEAIEMSLLELLSLRAQDLARLAKSLEESFALCRDEINGVLSPAEEEEE